MLVRTVGTVTDLRVLPAFCECQDLPTELTSPLKILPYLGRSLRVLSTSRDCVQTYQNVMLGPEWTLHRLYSPQLVCSGTIVIKIYTAQIVTTSDHTKIPHFKLRAIYYLRVAMSSWIVSEFLTSGSG